MSSGYSAAIYNILTNEQIEELLPIPFNTLKQVLLSHNLDFDRTLVHIELEEDDECKDIITKKDIKEIRKSLQDLQLKFRKKFKMEIFPVYHDDPEPYDEFEGFAWDIVGAYQKTKNAHKVEQLLKDPGTLDNKTVVYYG